ASIPQQRQPLSPVTNGQRPPPRSEPTSGPPFGYQTYQPPYSYPSSTAAVTTYRAPLLQHSPWRNANSDFERAEEVRKAAPKESPSNRPAYGESVKRHLDIFDLETSLNEVKIIHRSSIAEGSGRALEFSRHYGTHAHQTQRSGPIPGSLPTLNECDDMIRQQTRVLDSVSRIRDVIHKQQQQALAEQRNHDQQNHKTAASEAEEETHSYADKLEGAGGFAGPDAKKRRGRAAPPDYAKLTRKMGNKTSTGSSNLRPKESSPSSP
ncbi:MAG: hypothetical protein Q9217_006302, partial [Psora testacea]